MSEQVVESLSTLTRELLRFRETQEQQHSSSSLPEESRLEEDARRGEKRRKEGRNRRNVNSLPSSFSDEEHEDLPGMIRDMENQIRLASMEASHQREEYNRRIHAFEETIRALKEELRLTRLGKQLSEKRMHELEMIAKTKDEAIDELNEEVNSLQEHLEGARLKNASLQSELSSANTMISEQHQSIHALHAQIHQQSMVIESKLVISQQLIEDLDETKNLVEDLSRENSRLKKLMDSHSSFRSMSASQFPSLNLSSVFSSKQLNENAVGLDLSHAASSPSMNLSIAEILNERDLLERDWSVFESRVQAVDQENSFLRGQVAKLQEAIAEAFRLGQETPLPKKTSSRLESSLFRSELVQPAKVNDEKDIRLSQQPNSESIPPTRRFFSISDIDEVSELNKFIQLEQSDLTLSPSSRTSRDDENINHSDVVHHQEHALDDVIHREPETPVSADRRLSLDSKRHARTFGSDPIRSPPRFPVRQTQSQSPPSMRRSLSAARTMSENENAPLVDANLNMSSFDGDALSERFDALQRSILSIRERFSPGPISRN